MDPNSLKQIGQWLWPKGRRDDVWMIVDAARERQVFSALLDCHLRYSCLYSGQLPPELELAAPYLVQLDYEHRGTVSLIRQGWGKSWGVFFRSGEGMNVLRRHLRGFLLVHGPGGKRMVFRYYDPRVLRTYLPTCTSGELVAVFGPIESFCMEGKEPGSAVEFRVEHAQLTRKKLDISMAIPPAS